jgi:hypothetical protein
VAATSIRKLSTPSPLDRLLRGGIPSRREVA